MGINFQNLCEISLDSFLKTCLSSKSIRQCIRENRSRKQARKGITNPEANEFEIVQCSTEVNIQTKYTDVCVVLKKNLIFFFESLFTVQKRLFYSKCSFKASLESPFNIVRR